MPFPRAGFIVIVQKNYVGHHETMQTKRKKSTHKRIGESSSFYREIQAEMEEESGELRWTHHQSVVSGTASAQMNALK